MYAYSFAEINIRKKTAHGAIGGQRLVPSTRNQQIVVVHWTDCGAETGRRHTSDSDKKCLKFENRQDPDHRLKA